MSIRSLILTDPRKRLALEQAIEQLFEDEIQGKTGAEGKIIIAIHTKAKKLVPHILPQSITLTLPQLLTDLEPEYVLARIHKISLVHHVLQPDRRFIVVRIIRQAFDTVVAKHVILRPLYQVLKSRIEYHIGLALPRLALLLQTFL